MCLLQEQNVAELNFNLFKMVILHVYAASPELGAPCRTLWVILAFNCEISGPNL